MPADQSAPIPADYRMPWQGIDLGTQSSADPGQYLVPQVSRVSPMVQHIYETNQAIKKQMADMTRYAVETIAEDPGLLQGFVAALAGGAASAIAWVSNQYHLSIGNAQVLAGRLVGQGLRWFHDAAWQQVARIGGPPQPLNPVPAIAGAAVGAVLPAANALPDENNQWAQAVQAGYRWFRDGPGGRLRRIPQ